MQTIVQVSEETLTLTRCWCGVLHAVPQSLYDRQQRNFHDGREVKGIYCPLGHPWVPKGTPKYKQLEAQLQRERAAHDQQRANFNARLEKEKRATTAQKAAKTRLKNRVAAGVCPCCTRHFDNLGRHMATQHPDFKRED